ncbi:MAG: DUF1186 domain-containing protein [Alphaproteobacteria bacterium]|nr:MAG: DUF1186 domain-containing protein [Alphaproteobacteria bacterium]
MSTVEQSFYTVGGVVAYGPDNKRATKLVARVYSGLDGDKPKAVEEWSVDEGDIRQDPSIREQVTEFFKRHGAKPEPLPDLVCGCPHEEGVDYPVGRKCPHCHFWHDIDPLTLEPIEPPVATLSPEEVLRELSKADATEQPLEALESADAQREALTEPLLQAMEKGVAQPEDLSEGDGMLFGYACYLLAMWREPRAYPLMVRWLSLPDEQAFDLGGDTVTESGNRLLASVYDGNPEPILNLIHNEKANPYCRGEAVMALCRLANWGEMPRDAVIEIYRKLIGHCVEKKNSPLWDYVVQACVNMEALELFPEIRAAFERGLEEPMFVDREDLDEVEAGPRGWWIEQDIADRPPIMDVASETVWWKCFSDEEDFFDFDPEDYLDSDEDFLASAGELGLGDVIESNAPVRSGKKVGRNEPCPCGSGKKYKKCCGK